jgi:uncharacterized radical SAM superfamily protein
MSLIPGRFSCSSCLYCGTHSRHHSVLKQKDGEFLLLVASVDKKDGQELQLDGSKAKIRIQYGDFSDALKKASEALAEVCKITHP